MYITSSITMSKDGLTVTVEGKPIFLENFNPADVIDSRD